MNLESHSPDPLVSAVLQDPVHDAHEEAKQQPHDQATEVAHAWKHFYENAWFFAGFFSIIVLTVIAFNINFGPWNLYVALGLAVLRSGFIAIFLASLFKSYSLVFKTLTFTAVFLAGMIFLSLWDSTIRNFIGDPISLPPKLEAASPPP
jgi:lipopolysaccharide export LptBFGC system permease protein LptF